MSLLWTAAAAFQLDGARAEDHDEWYHISPKYLQRGTELKPPGPHRGNFDESSGEHVYVTPHRERAEQYDYMLYEQGHPKRHLYEVHPHGELEEDPNDPESYRTKDPVEVTYRQDRFRNKPIYTSPSGEKHWDLGGR